MIELIRDRSKNPSVLYFITELILFHKRKSVLHNSIAIAVFYGAVTHTHHLESYGENECTARTYSTVERDDVCSV